MATLPFGIILFILALIVSAPLDQNWGVFLNIHSILLVIGGTFALLAFTTPLGVLRNLGRDLKNLTATDPDINDFASDFEELAIARRLSRPSKHPLINYAVELWDNGTAAEMFHVLLSQRRDKIDASSFEAVQTLRNLSKYPPALGMIGTVMGLVGLFTNLTSENRSSLGPALALALTATFFGLLLANGLVMPLADRLHVAHMARKAHTQSVYEIIVLIHRREPVSLIRGEVKDRAAAEAV